MMKLNVKILKQKNIFLNLKTEIEQLNFLI